MTLIKHACKTEIFDRKCLKVEYEIFQIEGNSRSSASSGSNNFNESIEKHVRNFRSKLN